MFTYSVSATGPKGFQVSVAGPDSLVTNLIDDFASLAAAEAFVDWMRKIDAGQTTIAVVPLLAGASVSDLWIDDLIQRSRKLRVVAAKARSDARDARSKALYLCSRMAMNREVWYRLRETYASFSPHPVQADTADCTTDDLIQRSRAARAAAENACSRRIEIEVHHLREMAAMRQQQRRGELLVFSWHDPTRSPDRRTDRPDSA